MRTEPTQLVLELPHRPALGVEDFLVSPANAAAVGLIDRWPDWGYASALVVGPRQSGKSHLANVWRRKSGADLVAATLLEESHVGVLTTCGSLVVEDIDHGIGDERVLFHLLNIARERRLSLLLTALRPTGGLSVRLPDLRSRLRALPLVSIGAPDEPLLRALLVKLFADRQLLVEPHVINHIARHAERSMAAIARIVAELDRLALAARRPVTRVLAAEVLSRLAAAGD
jgi:chromosomal replication initiation ATPase DnaA